MPSMPHVKTTRRGGSTSTKTPRAGLPLHDEVRRVPPGRASRSAASAIHFDGQRGIGEVRETPPRAATLDAHGVRRRAGGRPLVSSASGHVVLLPASGWSRSTARLSRSNASGQNSSSSSRTGVERRRRGTGTADGCRRDAPRAGRPSSSTARCWLTACWVSGKWWRSARPGSSASRTRRMILAAVRIPEHPQDHVRSDGALGFLGRRHHGPDSRGHSTAPIGSGVGDTAGPRPVADIGFHETAQVVRPACVAHVEALELRGQATVAEAHLGPLARPRRQLEDDGRPGPIRASAGLRRPHQHDPAT